MESRSPSECIWMHFFPWCCEYSTVSWASTLPCPTRCFWQTVSCPCVRNLENSVAVLVITQPLWAEGARLILCSQHICSALSSVEARHISSSLHLSTRSKVRSKVIPLNDALSKTPRKRQWCSHMIPFRNMRMFIDDCTTVDLRPERPDSHILLLLERCINAVNEHISPNSRFGEHDHLQAADKQVEKDSSAVKICHRTLDKKIR